MLDLLGLCGAALVGIGGMFIYRYNLPRNRTRLNPKLALGSAACCFLVGIAVIGYSGYMAG